MRCVITRVLPDPAPARISRGPSLCCTASHWGGLSCACQAVSIHMHPQYHVHYIRRCSCVLTHEHSAVLSLPQQRLEIRQVGVGVDTQDLLSIGYSDMRHTVVLGHCDSDYIREVLLSLGVLTAN